MSQDTPLLEQIANLHEDMANKITSLGTQLNEEINEFNTLLDELESKDKLIKELEEDCNKKHELIEKQNAVIEASITVKKEDNKKNQLLNARIRELESLDPKRLAKVNKTQKATIADLKTKNTELDKKRKEVLATNKTLVKDAKNTGAALFYFDPATKNGIRVIPNLFVGKNNKFNGVIGSPVVEFFHHDKGITRQGFLDYDGEMNWASAANSMPSGEESLVAKEQINSLCKQLKIKVNT